MPYKLTKQQEADLKKLAASLPACSYQAFAGKITGAELIKEFPNVTEEGGKPIVPGKMYKRPVWLPANHFKRLKQVYKDGGNPAIQKYINAVLGPEKPEPTPDPEQSEILTPAEIESTAKNLPNE